MDPKDPLEVLATQIYFEPNIIVTTPCGYDYLKEKYRPKPVDEFEEFSRWAASVKENHEEQKRIRTKGRNASLREFLNQRQPRKYRKGK